MEKKISTIGGLKDALETEIDLNRRLTVELDFVKENISQFQRQQIHVQEVQKVLQDELQKKEEIIALLNSGIEQ